MRTVRQTNLTVISPPETPSSGVAAETTTMRIRRLQEEARSLARSQVAELQEEMRRLAELCAEVASGGEAYPVGAREIASRMAEELDARAHTLQALSSRA